MSSQEREKDLKRGQNVLPGVLICILGISQGGPEPKMGHSSIGKKKKRKNSRGGGKTAQARRKEDPYSST